MQWIEHVQANGLHLWTLEGHEQTGKIKFIILLKIDGFLYFLLKFHVYIMYHRVISY